MSPFSLFSDSEEGTGFVVQCHESRLNRGFSDKNIVRHVKSVIFAWRLYNWAIFRNRAHNEIFVFDVFYDTSLGDNFLFFLLNAATVQSSPVLAPGDIIDISVVAKNQEVVIPFNKRLMQGEAYLRGNASKAVEYYLIDQAGNIDFPVIGRIHVAGKSKMEVEHLIQELLYPEYLNELPQVTVWIQNFSISVLGDVNRPGLFTIENERVSILDAIALAGDLAITGRRDNVLLVRVNSDGTKSIARINLNDKNLISSPYFYLQQNDVLYVQPNKSKANSAVVVPPTTSLIFSATSILLTIANLIITAWSISK